MLYTILFLFVSVFSTPECDRMNDVRSYYGNIKTEKELIAFIDLLEKVKCNDSTPYMASAVMQKAQFAFAPWTQYRYFIKGKRMLENFIEQNPENIDARYIRFLVQSNAPFFLGYFHEKEDDVAKILAHLDKTNMSEAYKKQIKKHIKEFNQ